MKLEDKVFKCKALQYALLKDYVGSEVDFTDKCMHCNRSIYVDYEKLMESTGMFGVSKGYSISDASTKLLEDCPHCDKAYRGVVLEIYSNDTVKDIKELLIGIKEAYLNNEWYYGIDVVLSKYNLKLDDDLNIEEL